MQFKAQMRPKTVCWEVLAAFQSDPEAICVPLAYPINQSTSNAVALEVLGDTQMRQPHDLTRQEVQCIADDVSVMDRSN